ncbi:MAG: hypothetical protein M0P71_00770 [Melioribacteraceae bacterium]|nr:hypothetical protein [Melioribacteraceae bacterium]
MSTKFTCGANELVNNNYDGEEIGEVIPKIKDILNITRDHQVTVNGEEVDSDYEIEAGDNIEFVKNAGQKGNDEVTVSVAFGANEVDIVSRDGSTILEVLEQAQQVLGLRSMDDTQILRNGQNAGQRDTVNNGDRIEIQKNAGSKG